MKVTVVTQTNCMPCKDTKNMLSTLGIPYEEVNARDAEDLIVKYEIKGAPTVIVESHGTTYTWTGHDPEKIEELV